LTVAQAAAPHDTLVLVVVVVLAGTALLFPSLALLFRLVLHGRFDPGTEAEIARAGQANAIVQAAAPGLVARSAGACLVAGTGLLTVADAPWAHAIGVTCLLAFVVLGFGAIRPTEIAAAGDEDQLA
jgi:cytochrome d ubiquinol oxidase subunit II